MTKPGQTLNKLYQYKDAMSIKVPPYLLVYPLSNLNSK
jgi:hypothetical protein